MCSTSKSNPSHSNILRFFNVWFSLVDVFATVNLELAKEIGKGIGLTQAEIDAIKPLDLPDGSD